MRGSGHVRSGPHTGLVAEQAPFDALHQGGTNRTTQCLLPAKCARHDRTDHAGQLRDVEQDDAQRQGDIAQRHDRHHDAADTGDALDAAKDGEQCERGDAKSHPLMIDPEGVLPSGTDRVALHGVERETEGDGDQHGEEHAHPAPAQASLHVISRSTDE